MFLLERMDKYWSIRSLAHEIVVNISDIVNLVYSVGFTTAAVYLLYLERAGWEGWPGNEAKLTTCVILNPYGSVAQKYGLHQGNWLVSADLGDRDKWGLVVVHAGTPMYRNSFLRTALGTRFWGAAEEGIHALVVLFMGLGTCETEAINLRISGELSLPTLQNLERE